MLFTAATHHHLVISGVGLIFAALRWWLQRRFIAGVVVGLHATADCGQVVWQGIVAAAAAVEAPVHDFESVDFGSLVCSHRVQSEESENRKAQRD